jgi:hypothetical protein
LALGACFRNEASLLQGLTLSTSGAGMKTDSGKRRYSRHLSGPLSNEHK